MQSDNQRMIEYISRLQAENDIISSAQTLLQLESTMNKVDIKWTRNYLSQEEVEDAAIDATTKASMTSTTTLPFQSLPPKSKDKHLTSDKEAHSDLSDMED